MVSFILIKVHGRLWKGVLMKIEGKDMEKDIKQGITNGMKIQEVRIGQKIQDEYGRTYIIRNIIDNDYVKMETGEVLPIHCIHPDPSEPYIRMDIDNKLKLVVPHGDYLFTACGETLEEVGYDAIWVSIANREQTASVDIACHQAADNATWLHTDIYQDGLITGCEDPDVNISISMEDLIQEKITLDDVETKPAVEQTDTTSIYCPSILLRKDGNFRCIQKYGRFYIQYRDETPNSFPWNLAITSEQVRRILDTATNPFALERPLLTHCQEHVEELKEYFITTALTDYMDFCCQCSQEETTKFLMDLKSYPDLRDQLYKTVMNHSMGQEGAAFYKIYQDIIKARKQGATEGDYHG